MYKNLYADSSEMKNDLFNNLNDINFIEILPKLYKDTLVEYLIFYQNK